MGKGAEILGWYRICRAMGMPRLYSAHTAYHAIKYGTVSEALAPDADHIVVSQDYIDSQREQAGMQ